MGDRKRIYAALVDGATEGLSDHELRDFVMTRCPKASSKKIVRAALLALSDPDVRDRNVLNTIYSLAIRYRLDDFGDDQADETEVSEEAPFIRTLSDDGKPGKPTTH
ncbi:hypothetical protein M8R20_11040 [Pseudomonas sp. R2.Fl]|nr:hypothetical protein [Pseudomonas sp. R2.Fl]